MKTLLKVAEDKSVIFKVPEGRGRDVVKQILKRLKSVSPREFDLVLRKLPTRDPKLNDRLKELMGASYTKPSE